jgi:hypothetical protein
MKEKNPEAGASGFGALESGNWAGLKPAPTFVQKNNGNLRRSGAGCRYITSEEQSAERLFRGDYCCGATAMLLGLLPAVKGEPATGVSAPLVVLMVKTETLAEPPLATFRNLPEGSTATARVPLPAAKGEPVTRVRAPLAALMVKALTEPPPVATYTNFPEGSTVTAKAPDELKGEPAIAVSAPLVALMVKARTLLLSSSATYKNLPVGSTAAQVRMSPVVAKGEPVTGVSAPLAALMLYA